MEIKSSLKLLDIDKDEKSYYIKGTKYQTITVKDDLKKLGAKWDGEKWRFGEHEKQNIELNLKNLRDKISLKAKNWRKNMDNIQYDKNMDKKDRELEINKILHRNDISEIKNYLLNNFTVPDDSWDVDICKIYLGIPIIHTNKRGIDSLNANNESLLIGKVTFWQQNEAKKYLDTKNISYFIIVPNAN